MSRDDDSRAHGRRPLVEATHADDALLPLRHVRRIDEVREDVFRATGDLDALHDRNHLASFVAVSPG
jgi:hypothetical protein